MTEVLHVIPDELITQHGSEVNGLRGHLVQCPSLEGLELNVVLELLHRYPGQPRSIFKGAQLDSLAVDLARSGQKEPMVTTPFYFEDRQAAGLLVANGERRLRALQGVESISSARAVVRGYLTEADLFKAAMTSHKESKTLSTFERNLMLARLFALEEAANPDLAVNEFAAREGFHQNTVHDSRRIASLHPCFLEWGHEGRLASSSFIYLANRQKSPKESFPESELIRLMGAAMRGSQAQLSLRMVQDLFKEACEASGQSVEAGQRRVREQMAHVMTAARRVATEFDLLQGLVDDVEIDEVVKSYLFGPNGMGSGQIDSVAFAMEIFLGHHVEAKRTKALAKKEA